MPIVGRTPEACGREFRNHIARLISETLTRTDPVRLIVRDTLLQLSFPEGAIPIKTKFGRLYFYMAQALDAVEDDDGRFRLRTVDYWYRLQGTKSPTEDALLRWEYKRADGIHDSHPRHHAHASASVALPTGDPLNLNEIHLPTGWVTIEEVIRFAITELQVKPPCGSRWPSVLRTSEEAFFEKFTGKRLKKPKA